MKIVIAGGGKIGSSITRNLISSGHDITVIDNNAEIISNIADSYDVICIFGNATNPDILEDADCKNADLVIAATQSDEVNMVCAVSAKTLGAKHVIARIRDTEYMNRMDFFSSALGLDMAFNPELECAREISRILSFPGAARVDSFSKASLEIVSHKIQPGSRLDGTVLKDISSKFGAKVLVSVVERDNDVFIPGGDFVLSAGDRLNITGSMKELKKFFISSGAYIQPVKNTMIMGGGRISVYLAAILEESGVDVTIVEKDKSRCELLCDLLPSADVIYGDACNSDVLFEEGINSRDAFVALSGDDGDNIITSMYVSHCSVDKIITKVDRGIFNEILESSNLDCVVSPEEVVAQQISKYVCAMNDASESSILTLYRIADGKADAIEFDVGSDSKCVNIPLKDLKLKKNVLIAAVIRKNKIILPDGNTSIIPGDSVVVVSQSDVITKLDDIEA